VKAKPALIFMGTPEFAVPSLEALHQGGYSVLCVVTRPDRPKGRKRHPAPSPVKIVAENKGYPVLQPESIRSGAILEKIRSLKPDVIVVVAFGAILPEVLLKIPPYGALNIHASLLPKYRGPAPIQWAVINGDHETGVTIMQMDAGLDTGNILGVATTPISNQDTGQTLHDRLSRMGAKLLVKTLEKMISGTLRPVPQDQDRATYAPMLKKCDGHIDWKASAETIDRCIRGLIPWPGAFTLWGEKTIRIFRARVEMESVPEPPGMVLESEGGLKVATGKGTLGILELQVASGRRMVVQHFLRGNRISKGTILS